MKTRTHHTGPERDVRPRVLSATDFDATIVLLSLLIVAVCGTVQLILMLPQALGAAS